MNLTRVRELLNQDTVTLWTIQDLAAWQLAEERGVLRADGRRICFPEYFRPAYQWLMEQMSQKIDNYPGCYPVWAWPEKPDLRWSGLAHKGTPQVRIECVLPTKSVLFSDFQSWDCVLSNSYLALSQKDFRRFHTQLEHAQKIQDQPELERLHTQIVASWQRIFDFQLLASNPYWHGEELFLQATFARLSLSTVRKVTYFIAR